MKRRNFLTSASFVLASLSVPVGIAAMSMPSVILGAKHTEMLAAFKQTLSDYPGPAELKARLATVAFIEYSDPTTLRFRSLTGERCELRQSGDRFFARLLS
jgi:hypothetical protein